VQVMDFNKQLGAQRQHRSQYLDNYWKRPHEQPQLQTTQAEADLNTVAPQTLQSPQAAAGSGQPRLPQEQMPHTSTQMMPQSYPGYQTQQNPMTSPVQAMQRSLPASQVHAGSPSMPMSSTQTHRQNSSYGGYAQGQMWQTPQPQPSPLSQAHTLASYGQQQMPPPQMHGQAGMGYGQMNTMANPAYANMNRNMYQPSHSPQQFNMQSSGAQQPGMQGWANPNNMSQYGQGFQ